MAGGTLCSLGTGTRSGGTQAELEIHPNSKSSVVQCWKELHWLFEKAITIIALEPVL